MVSQLKVLRSAVLQQQHADSVLYVALEASMEPATVVPWLMWQPARA